MKIILLSSLISCLAFGLFGQTKYDIYVFLHDECLISQFYTITLDSLHTEYANDSMKFTGIFPNAISSEKDIKAFRNKYKLDFRMLKDTNQLVTNRLGATVTPEVFVVNNNTNTILYKGRIDDSYFRVGKRRTVKTTSELKDVLEAIKNNQPLITKNQPSIGCIIQGL